MLDVGTILGIISLVITSLIGAHITIRSNCFGLQCFITTNENNNALDIEINDVADIEISKTGSVTISNINDDDNQKESNNSQTISS